MIVLFKANGELFPVAAGSIDSMHPCLSDPKERTVVYTHVHTNGFTVDHPVAIAFELWSMALEGELEDDEEED